MLEFLVNIDVLNIKSMDYNNPHAGEAQSLHFEYNGL